MMSDTVVAEEVHVLRFTATDAVLVALVVFFLVWKFPRLCARYLAKHRKRKE